MSSHDHLTPLPLDIMTHPLQSMLNPGTIAVVGASPKPGSFGGAVLANLAQHFRGKVCAVNPQYKEINGYACYPDLQALPEKPDCVCIAVPSRAVPDVLLQAADCAIPSAIIFSSGFAETGTPEGIALQNRIAEIARTRGIRVLGPNCTGIVNVRSGASCNILPSVKLLPLVPGDVGLVGQSGALGYVVFQAMHRGVGFSHLISTGNSSDVDIADLIDYLIDDPHTKVIATLFESVPDGPRLRAALQRAFEAGKPVVVYKIGVTQSGQKAALSHSGMLAGDAATYQALFARTGAIQVDCFEALLETAVFFARSGTPTMDSGVGIISGSGGSVVMAADKADTYGISLPEPQPETAAALRQRLPAFASFANPADITAESIRDEGMYEECVEIFAADTGFAGIVILMPSAHGEPAIRRAQGISELAGRLEKPLSLVWMNEWYEGIGSRVYDQSTTLAVFRSLDRCMSAYRLWFEYGRKRRELANQETLGHTSDPTEGFDQQAATGQARDYLQGFSPGACLTETQTRHLLQIWGIVCNEEALCTSPGQAAESASRMGYPVVAKIQAPDIQHKSDVGGVKLALQDEQAVRKAYVDILNSVSGLDLPNGIQGISIQKMIEPGVEMFVGTRLDPAFGPTIVYGFGGTLVEVLKDVAVSLAPVSAQEVRRNLDGLKMRKLLDGVRGAKPCDIEHFAQQVARVSEMAAALAGEITEIDINPIVLHNKGGVAIDGLVVRSEA
ncbi:acetate--CoA ligase family protein [Orrella marina]|nr:acetate--CoA ligase family protein [Orrella marina]